MVRLFHFSEQGDIATFEPRAVDVPARRPEGMDWLNGPLVWAIDDWHQPLYLFPRECPRLILWPTATTTVQDRRIYWTSAACRMIAYVEWRWFARIADTILYRYALPAAPFESLDDAGMWVSRVAVAPHERCEIADLPAALAEADVELRFVKSLEPLKPLFDSSIHVSGIRLRNIGS